MPKTEYHIASEIDPYGTVRSRKREALRECRRNNRELRNDNGATLPPPEDWTDEEDLKYGHLIYEVTAIRKTDTGILYGDVDPHSGRIDWV